MNKKEAKNLFDRYIQNECTPKEVELLHAYLDSFQDRESLLSQLDYDEEVKNKLWDKIKSEINVDERGLSFRYRRYIKYAAVFIGVIGGLLWYQLSRDSVQETQPLISEGKIILKTSDSQMTEIDLEGENLVLDKQGQVVGKHSGNRIKYDRNDETDPLAYNEILVPNGMRFQIILSDGSLVHLNSGSSLRYPVNFIAGRKREVFLTGEAYFEVVKLEKSPFLVSTEEMGVRVLGTRFNVNTYLNSEAYTVLAEGKVEVYHEKSTNKDPIVIEPGQKASLAIGAIEVDLVDPNDYLAWRNGILSFNNEPFGEILNKIERHYGVVIQNDYEALSNIQFRGKFKDETITDLLDTFKESAGFKYTIDDNIIKIMKTE